jgi:PST family polysaccharide transporter
VILWAIVDWRPRFSFSRRHFRDLFGFGFNVLVTNLLRIFGGQADRLLLGFYFGAAEVGYYSVAQRLVTIITDFVAGSTERAVVPLFARIQEDRARVARGLIIAQRLLSLTVIPAFVGLAVVAPSLIRVAVGDQWDPSVLPTRILAFFSLAYCLGFFFGHVVTALGRPTIRLGVVLAQSLTQAGLSLIGVAWGIPGVATAMAATQIIFYGVELTVLRRMVRFSVPAYLGEALVPAVAAAAMAAAVLGLESVMADQRAAFQLAAGIGVGVLVYGAVLLLFARSRIRELVGLVKGLRG